ncbi:MAG: N-acetyltransferase [Puniceicoccaceae bacterium]|nr:MAG: N-acetyltransferase [Puniceicoccaceae bacterium]
MPADSAPPLPPLGRPLPDWRPPPAPPAETIAGPRCRLEPLDPAVHADALAEAFAADAGGAGWTYLPYGPFGDAAALRGWLEACAGSADPLFYALVPTGAGTAAGLAAYLSIRPAAGSIEVGHIHFSPALRRSPAATEAMVLMMRRAFALGYRRYEWKCDALNAASRAAARRLGFSFEGVFRQAAVVKGRNRDTAWYAITDSDWLHLEAAFERWLAPENFDAGGCQRLRLSELTAPLRRPLLELD